MLVMDGYGDDCSSSAYAGPGQPARAHLVDPHHQLARPRLHVRHRVSGFCRLRRRRQGDGARRVRRGHLRRALPRRDPADAGRRLCRQHGLLQLRHVRPAAPLQAQVHRRVRAAARPGRAAHRPPSRRGLRAADRDRGDRPASGARAAEEARHAQPVHDRAAWRSIASPTPRSWSTRTCERLWVPPCASDTGAPLGSALWHYHQTLGNPRGFELQHAFYGKAYGDQEIVEALEEAGLRYRRLPQDQLLAARRAGSGRRQDRRLVPGPLRDGAARARQPLHPRRSAPCPTCATCSTPRSRSASPSARLRPRCWWSGRTNSSRSTSPTRS